MAVITKDNMIVVQKKFTELEICTTILALQDMIKKVDGNDMLVKSCNKVITKLKSSL